MGNTPEAVEAFKAGALDWICTIEPYASALVNDVKGAVMLTNGVDLYGNKVYGGITSPGLCPSVVTVGAVTTYGTNLRADDTVAVYSSRGPTRSRATDPVTGEVVYDNLAKPDLVAPGSGIVSLERFNNAIVTALPELHVDIGPTNNRGRYMRLSGTSMAAGVVSGTAALILQANPSLTPNMVKAILMYSAQIMEGADLFEQGAGLLNAEGAVRIAASMRGNAGTLLPGQKLTVFDLPPARTTVAGETIVWSQSIVWGGGLLEGGAIIGTQQYAYASALIWGSRDTNLWGAGVTWSDGIYSDASVAYGSGGRWSGVTWDQGTLLGSGLIWRDDLYASGVYWLDRQMTDAFFTLDPASLIWGYTRLGYDLGLIWGYSGFDSSLIWGCAGLEAGY